MAGYTATMAVTDWKEILAQRFDKQIQPPEKGKHGYRLLHPVTIRADGKDFSVPSGALFTFPQDDLVVIAEKEHGPVTYSIALSAVAAITFG
jgi:hypothetical protein